jgi:protein-tyrosine phosphatase
MIDFHSHLLPGTDDGPIDVEESILMARSLADFGFKTVCCTPHSIKGYYEHTPQHIREATMMLQADLDNADVELELWPGMEYCLDECFIDLIDDLQPLGETRLILCEAPQQANPGIVLDSLEMIIGRGYIPLIAHPERSDFFYEKIMARGSLDAGREQQETEPEEKPLELVASNQDPKPQKQSLLQKLNPFVRKNSKLRIQNSKLPNNSSLIAHRSALSLPSECLFQANLGSFTGFYGSQPQRRAYDLIKLGAYTCFASDLHDNRSARQVLKRDKMEANPLLRQLASWDGKINPTVSEGTTGAQIDLF